MLGKALRCSFFTKMNCTECEKIKNKKNIVYEDQLVIAMLDEKPSTRGHILLMPKEHHIIVEQIPDELISHMFLIANKLSIVLFESLGAQGTNILIQNGISAGQKSNHVMINIIPRDENDELSFHWNPIKMSETDLNSIQTSLKDEIDMPKETKKDIKEIVKEPEIIEEDKDNYMLKQLERIP